MRLVFFLTICIVFPRDLEDVRKIFSRGKASDLLSSPLIGYRYRSNHYIILLRCIYNYKAPAMERRRRHDWSVVRRVPRYRALDNPIITVLIGGCGNEEPALPMSIIYEYIINMIGMYNKRTYNVYTYIKQRKFVFKRETRICCQFLCF